MTVCVQPMPSPPGIGSVRSRLARFDADLLSLHNLLHRQTASWRIVLGQRAMHVSLARAGGECRRPVRVAIRFGQAYLELVVPSRLFELSGLGWLPGASVDTQADTLLLEQAWLSWIEPLEALSGRFSRGLHIRSKIHSGSRWKCGLMRGRHRRWKYI